MFIYISWLCINQCLVIVLEFFLFSSVFKQDLLLNVRLNLHLGSFLYLENYWPYQALGESKSYLFIHSVNDTTCYWCFYSTPMLMLQMDFYLLILYPNTNIFSKTCTVH